MFEWLRRRGGTQLIGCASCGRALPYQMFTDYGETDQRTYYCNTCRQVGFGPLPPATDWLWRECGKSAGLWYELCLKGAKS